MFALSSFTRLRSPCDIVMTPLLASACKASRTVDAERADDKATYGLSKQIAKTLERELSYPGQIKVSVVRQTRAVKFAV